MVPGSPPREIASRMRSARRFSINPSRAIPRVPPSTNWTSSPQLRNRCSRSRSVRPTPSSRRRMLPRPSTKTGARPKKAVELSVPGWFTSTDPARGVFVAVLIVLEPGHHRGDQPRAEIYAIEQHDINVDDEEDQEH